MSNDLPAALAALEGLKFQWAAHPVSLGPQKDEPRSKGKMVKGSKRSAAAAGQRKRRSRHP